MASSDYCLITHEPEEHHADFKSAIFWFGTQIVCLTVLFNAINFAGNYFCYVNTYVPRAAMKAALYILPFFFLFISHLTIAHIYNDNGNTLDKMENSKNAFAALSYCKPQLFN